MTKLWTLLVAGALSLALAVKPGEPLLDFLLLDPKGQPVTPATMSKPAVIVFWASWCTVCKAEFPGLHRVAEETGVPFYVISREPRDTREVVLEYMKTYPRFIPSWPRTGTGPTRWRPGSRSWASPGPSWWTGRGRWWPSSPGGRAGRPC